MMKNIFKILVLPLLILLNFSNVSWGQDDPVIQFSGKIISASGSKMSGVVVTVKRDGGVVKSETTASNGKYGPIEVPMGYTYLITYAKNGYILKTVKIDSESGYFAEEVDLVSKLDLSPSMVEKKPDVDYSPITSKPLMEVNINPQDGGLAINSGYTNQQANKFNKFIKDLENKANEDETKFNDLVKAADSKASSGDYTGAVKDYEAALSIKADPNVSTKVTDAKSKMKTKADFDKLVAEGDQLVTSSDFDGGIAKFEQAKQLFPTDKNVIAKIKDANDKKIAAAGAELKKEYDARMAEAKTAFDGKDYAFAQKKYEEASVLIPTEQEPKTKIKEIQKLIQDQIALEQKYATLITEGDKAMLNESYDLAIEKFTAALEIKSETHSQTELDKAIKLKKEAEEEANAQKAAQEKFDQLIADGSNALNSKDMDGAESKFNEALGLDIDNPKAEAELAKVTAARAALEAENEAAAAAEKKAEFEAKITAGDEKLSSDDFENAIVEYQSALDMGVDNAKANAKLEAARTAQKAAEDAAALADAAAAKLEAFNQLISEGQSAYDDKGYNGAIAKYEEALTMGIDDPRAQDGLNLAKDALAQLEKDKEAEEAAAKQAEFDELLKQGDSELTSGNYDDAIAKYTTAKGLDVDNPLAEQRITEANSAKQAAEDASNEAAALEEKKQAFEGLIADGDTQLEGEGYDEAIAKYTSALDLDYNNAVAQGKIDSAMSAKKAAEDAKTAAEEAQKKADFDELIAAGDDKQSANDFDGAISQFQNALDLDYDNPTAQSKMDAAKAAKQQYEADLAGEEKAQLEAQKKADFEALLGDGDAKLTSEDFEGAISDYTNALNLDYDNPTAQGKIDAAKAEKEAYDAKIAADQSAANAAAKQQEYDDFIAAGDEGLSAESFDAAISAYESALATEVNNTEANAKLIAAKAAKKKFEDDIANADANAALEQKKKDFEAKTTEGSLKLADNDFDGAISSFNSALALDFDNPKAQEMINSAKLAKEEYEKNKEAEAADNALIEFNALITEGDAARDAKDYDAAADFYTQANVKIPTSPIPQERLDALLPLREAKTQEEDGDVLFNKLLGVVENMTQKEEYVKAKNLLESKKPVFPLKAAEIDENIIKLNQLIADQEKEAAKEAEYKALVAKADGAFEKSDWDASEGDYIKALSLYDREYPKDQLALIAENKAAEVVENAASKENELKRTEYDALMAKGAADFSTKEYESALTNYKAARNLLPDETKPQIEIDRINKILKDIADSSSEDLAYTNALTKADAKRDDAIKSGKDLEDIESLKIAIVQGGEAKDLYSAANALNSSDKYPQEEVDKLNTLIGDWNAIVEGESQYRKIIAKADEFFNAKELDKAEGLYKRAEGFKEGDPYPPAQLAKIASLRNTGEKIDNYNELIKEGNELFNNEEYDPALVKFNEAKDIKDSQYPNEKIRQIKDIKTELAEKERLEQQREAAEIAANSTPDLEPIDPMDLNDIRSFFREQENNRVTGQDNEIDDFKNRNNNILAEDLDQQRDKGHATNDLYDAFEKKKSETDAGFDIRRTERLPDIEEFKKTELDKGNNLTDDQTSRTNVTNDTYTDFSTERSGLVSEQDKRRISTLDDFDSYEGTQREVSDKYNEGEQIRTEATKLYNTKTERKSEQLTKYWDENREADATLIESYKLQQSELGESQIERSTDNTYATFEAKEAMIAKFEEDTKDQDNTRADKTVPQIELYKKTQSEGLSQLTYRGTDATYATKDHYAKMENDISELTNTYDQGRKDNLVEVDAYKLSESQKQSKGYQTGVDRTQSVYESNDSIKSSISEQFVDSDKGREGTVDQYGTYANAQSKAKGSEYDKHVNGGVDKANELNGVKSQKATMFSDANVDPLAAKHGEGIHEETFQRTSASGEVLEIIVQRIVVVGNKADTYKMVSNRWSTNYFKNGAIIPQTTWDTDTN